MDVLLQSLVALALMIFAAKAAGYASVRLGQPAVLGELIVGLLLGPSLLNMMHWPICSGDQLEAMISFLAHLGVIFLMFVAGLEVDLGTMAQTGRIAIISGVSGVLAPVILGALATLPFGYDLQHGLFTGLVLAATSVSISAQTLMELGVLRSRVGMALLGAAVVDDVLVILLLSAFIAVAGGNGGVLAILWVLVKMLLFLGIALLLGILVIPRAANIVSHLPISEGIMSLAVVVTFLYSWAAEALGGIAAITGAFLAGVIFARTPARKAIEGKVHAIAYSWLVPIFFVSIGLETDVRTLGAAGIPIALAVLGVALISKVIGCGSGALVAGCTPGEALRLGVGMTSRGEVGLIVASVGLSTGLITDAVFASVVLMVLVTTLVTPIALRALYPKGAKTAEPAQVTAETPKA
ncbi:MAG: cation:proton antiporter [Anaerolineales bacterium]